MRLPLVVLWTLLCVPLLIIPSICVYAGAVRSMKAGSWVCHIWAKGLLRIFGVKLIAEGPRPPAGAFLVSNHVSWLDILVLSAWQPTSFVAKKEVAKIPAIGFFSGIVGTLFLDRESRRDAHRLAQDLRGYLAGGAEITLFPEGYCADGSQLLPFKPSLLGAAAELDTPCVPIAIRYDLAEVVWNDGSTAANHAKRLMRARWRDRRMKPIVATLRSGTPTHHNDRKELARQLFAQVDAMFEPFAEPTEPYESGARHAE